MCQVSVSCSIAAPADEVWETVADYENPGKYLDAVDNCTMEGSGIGAIRSVKLKGGGYGIERLVHLDEENRIIAYTLFDSSLPLSGYIAVMHVRDTGENKSEVEWSSLFEPKGTSDEEAVVFIESFYAGGFEGLKKRHER